jgi:hypothetical protein
MRRLIRDGAEKGSALLLNAKAFFDLANLIRIETGESWESVLRVNRHGYYHI